MGNTWGIDQHADLPERPIQLLILTQPRSPLGAAEEQRRKMRGVGVAGLVAPTRLVCSSREFPDSSWKLAVRTIPPARQPASRGIFWGQTCRVGHRQRNPWLTLPGTISSAGPPLHQRSPSVGRKNRVGRSVPHLQQTSCGHSCQPGNGHKLQILILNLLRQKQKDSEQHSPQI